MTRGEGGPKCRIEQVRDREIFNKETSVVEVPRNLTIKQTRNKAEAETDCLTWTATMKTCSI